MKISRKLTVEIEGAKFFFEPQKLNDWATLTKLAELEFEERIDFLLNRLHAVEGLVFEDGDSISLEMVKDKGTLPADFYTKLFNAWSRAVIKGITGEAEEGKAPTAA